MHWEADAKGVQHLIDCELEHSPGWGPGHTIPECCSSECPCQTAFQPDELVPANVPDMSEYAQLLEHIQYLGLLQPSTPVEQFLLTGVEDLGRQQALLAYVIFRYRDAQAHVQKAIRDALANQRKQYAFTLSQYLQSPNPSTGKSWAVEAAKELSKGDATWVAWAHYISELEFREAQLEAYIEALDAKKTLLPALQGKENRLGR